MLGSPANGREDNALTVPAQPTTVQPVYLTPLQNIAPPPAPYIIQSLQPAVPLPMPGFLPPAWLPVTDLVVGRDGRYQQSDQIPEIQACLKAAVRRANANLAILDGFPDAHRRGIWLANALGTELRECRKASASMAVVDDRAQHDERYFNNLLHMVTRFAGTCRITKLAKRFTQINGRWSAFRQGVIDMARTLAVSPESSYGLHVPHSTDPNLEVQAGAARNLLLRDLYHFGKTAAVSTQVTNR